jgi:hypothetical protein
VCAHVIQPTTGLAASPTGRFRSPGSGKNRPPPPEAPVSDHVQAFAADRTQGVVLCVQRTVCRPLQIPIKTHLSGH